MENSNRSTFKAVLWLAIARLFTNITRRFHYAFLPEISRNLGTSLLSVQNVAATQAGVGITAPLFGNLSEQFGRKRVMMAGSAIVVLASIPGILFPDVFGVFYAVMVAWGFAKWLFDPALQAYVADRVPYSRRGFAIGMTELAWAGSLLVAAPLTGYLLELNGLRLVYAMIFVFNVAGFLIVAFFIPADHPHPETRASRPPFAVFRILRASPMALSALLFSVMLYSANEMLFIVYGGWMEDTFDLVLSQLGALTIVIALAEVIGEFFVIGASDRIGKRRLVLAGTLISSLGYATLPLLGFSLNMFLVGLFVVFVAVEIAIVSALPLMTEVLPHARAVMMSSNVAAQAIGRFSGAFIGSLSFSAGGFGLTGMLALVFGLCAFGIMWRLIREAS